MKKICADWEREIAGESDSDALRGHLVQCDGCRQFAAEISANRATLGTLVFDPAALDAVRNRVMAELRTSRHRTGWIWPAAAAACLAILCVSLLLLRFPVPEPPKPVVTLAGPPVFPRVAAVQAQTVPINRRHAPIAARSNREPLVIKMLTDDPNVVIIWIADQKGDAL